MFVTDLVMILLLGIKNLLKLGCISVKDSAVSMKNMPFETNQGHYIVKIQRTEKANVTSCK